ncbi:MAG: reverse transcriptase-like protein, partial [Chloroflexota bacterium]
MPTQQSQDRPRLYVAGTLALTDPGPAAAGVFIADPSGRVLSHRAYYLGYASAKEAAARAALAGLRLAGQLNLGPVLLRVDDSWLGELLQRPDRSPAAELPADLVAELRQLTVDAVEVVAAAANPARTVALAPLL